ncbi:MAG: matrixin family metalloprotease [Bacteroidota bacterium]
MKRTIRLFLAAFLSFIFLFTSCNDSEEKIPSKQDELIPKLAFDWQTPIKRKSSNAEIDKEQFIVAFNEAFSSINSSVKLVDFHPYIIAENAINVRTIDQQFESTLSSRWLPNDANRNWNADGNGEDIDYMSFTPFAIANGQIPVEGLYDQLYDVWENDGFCNTVTIDKNTYDLSMGNPSLILDLGPGFPTAADPLTDINVMGFIPGVIFEDLLGSENILGVAFSFVFIDENGDPVSTTRGKEDKAYAEIWFNDDFTWSFGPANGIDLESVVLHEFGHSLNLGHFGILQAFEQNGEIIDLKYYPEAVMNALYIGEARNVLRDTDKGNFCEAWGSWPWN